MTPPVTMQDLINLQATDAVQVAADGAAIVTAEQQVAAEQAAQQTDMQTQAADASTLTTDLLVTGPVASVSADGSSVTIYAAAGTNLQPNTAYPIASSVPIPPPASGS